MLWQLQRGTQNSLTCSVLGHGKDPILAVFDPTTPRVRQAEVHTDIVSLVYQADQIRGVLLSDGWHEVDVATGKTTPGGSSPESPFEVVC